ncbi:MAG: glutaminyl-peptide cyclotransferase [Bacteroidota bacterium]|nr:glutaminyl-peptide cyclotransferase [Bacteroidota bacterium]
MKKHLFLGLFLSISFFATGCKKEAEPPKQNPPQNTTQPAPLYTYEVVNTWHHDPDAFTQGLQYLDGELYESTGLNNHSSLRRVELTTGKVLQKIDIPGEYFAEGMTILGGKIYQLTYQTHIGFIYDQKTFKQLGSWHYEGEGWGLTNDGTYLIMSNGSNKISFLDPSSLAIVKTLEIFDEGFRVEDINELEYIKGEIYANIWRTDSVVRIDPVTGKVLGWINLAGLLMPQERTENVDVLNGIAYDEKGDRIFVTGKQWPKLFEIKIVKKSGAAQ